MAGYKGHSMSWNAVEAYENGEKPFSKWTKKDVLEECERRGATAEQLELIGKADAAAVRKAFLRKSSWHHTSSWYSRTNFYEVSFDPGRFNAELLVVHQEPKKASEKFLATVTFLVWPEQHRNHVHPQKITETGIVDGAWYVSEAYGKKRTGADSFAVVKKFDADMERFESDPNGAWHDFLEEHPEEIFRVSTKARQACPAEFFEKAVRRKPKLLPLVPANLRSEEMCLAAVRKNGGLLAHVPMRLRTRDLCETAVENAGHALTHVPDKLKDFDMCMLAVRTDPGNLDRVPQRIREDVRKEAGIVGKQNRWKFSKKKKAEKKKAEEAQSLVMMM